LSGSIEGNCTFEAVNLSGEIIVIEENCPPAADFSFFLQHWRICDFYFAILAIRSSVFNLTRIFSLLYSHRLKTFVGYLAKGHFLILL
jgi:hypothetical protein